MSDTIIDRWDKSAPRRERFLGDDEPYSIDGILLPPRDEHFIRRHGGHGRPYIRIVMPDGEVLKTETTYSRCTNFIKAVDRNEALERWNQRRAMEGFGRFALEFEARILSAVGNDDALNGIWLEARRMGGAELLAARGTAMHRVAEWYDIGQRPPLLPPAYERGLRGWIEVTRFFRWREIEKFMVCDELEVAGTPDRVGQYLPCPNCGRIFYIFDLKTGRVDEYTQLQQAMQLGVYANSAYYDVHTGRRTPQDDICRCRGVIIKLDIDTGVGQPYWVDIFTGWQIAHDLAPQVQRALKEKGLLVPFTPVPNIDALILTVANRDELVALWNRHRDHWTPAHIEAGKKRLAELSIEGE